MPTIASTADVIRTHAQERGDNVAIVQGGGPQRTRAADTDEREVFERHLRASDEIETPVDLVVWPENVVNVEGDVQVEDSADAGGGGDLEMGHARKVLQSNGS